MRMEQLDLWSFLDEAIDDARKVPSTNNGYSEEDEGCILSQSVNQESSGVINLFIKINFLNVYWLVLLEDHHSFMSPTNFTDWYQYGSYVKDTICRGVRVRYCGTNSANGKVEFGDTGKVLRLYRQSLDSLNVEVFIF